MSKTRWIFRYINHVFRAKNTKGHGIHSPYLFDFVQQVIYNKHPFYIFQQIEKQRDKLHKDKSIIQQTDYGTGTSTPKSVQQIAHTSLKRTYWGQLLFRIAHFTQAKTILELGTSLGITTSYLATAHQHSHCHTIEGCPHIAHIASKNFKTLSIDNINLSIGNIDNLLPNILSTSAPFDIIFIDANHRREPLKTYFEQSVQHIHSHSIMVIDDIHWSKEMEKAWNDICKHQQVTTTMDLFELGIVFFDPYFPKKTFYLNTFHI